MGTGDNATVFQLICYHMSNVSERVDWRLVVLVGILVGAAALQMVVAARLGDEDLQLVVIGTASIVMFLALGLVAWLVRARPEVRERE